MIELTEKIEEIGFNDTNIDELPDIQYNQPSLIVENWTYRVSDWTFHSKLQQQLVSSEIAPCEGSSFSPLPK